tara:strand:+ start:10180 stop:10677 length:498 start_codon:yes stop_codon:yes gene_type:complete
MNIFVVDKNPIAAARQLCNRHIVKMPLETAQMLCSALIAHGCEDAHYRATHKSHPCTKWAGKTRNNFFWLVKHGLEMCREYTRRYGKIHKCQEVIAHCNTLANHIPIGEQTPFPQAMPKHFQDADTVQAYRNYYNGGKGYMNKGRGPQWKSDPPLWFNFCPVPKP